MSEARAGCPICGMEVDDNPRYPLAVCPHCASRAASADGRPLRFGNEALSGGFAAFYADTGEPYPGGHDCWIYGVKCYADEAHMGGIVIEVA